MSSGGERLLATWRTGGAVLNGWLAVPSGYTAEIMAMAGWDSLTVDLQHGLQDYASLVACLQAMQAHAPVPLVRIPTNEPGIAGKALDAGAAGIICPMIDGADDARRFVAACRYPPAGQRSNGALRAGLYAGPDPLRTAGDGVLCIPMIETAAAVANLDAILDVPGVDALYVGPTDLRLSLGLPAVIDSDEPQVAAIYDEIIAKAAAKGVPVGLHCRTAAYARTAVARGFRMVTVGFDAGYVLEGARGDVAAFRAA